jgi:hypothetical protein
MATTPNASPSTANVTGSGTTATTSTISITANSAATLAAAQSAIKQATGNAPPNTFAVGSTTNVSQAAPGGKFVQGSVTTPRLNAAAAASPPPTNNGVSSSISVQNILGLAALAGAGLSVFNNVFGGTNLSQTLVNNSNTATPATSTNNVQDPAETARLARQNAAVTPSTNSTNNVQDPAETARLARQNADVATADTNTTLSDAETSQLFATEEDPFAAAESTTLSDAETSQLFAVEEDPFPNSETTVLSDEEAAKIFAQIDEEVIENESPASQLVAVDEDPFPNSETTVLSDEETAQLFAQVDEEVIESPFPEEIPDEESAFPPNTVAQQSAEVDELSAYPPGNQGDQPNEEIENPFPEDIPDEESAYPPNTVAQQSAEVDELSAYPPGDQGDQPNEEIADQKSAEVDELSAYPPYETPPTEEPESDNPQDGADQSGFNGATGDERNTQSQATQQDVSNFAAKPDWRVRLSLSPGATYLYKANPPGILAPLQATDGVIFPYTPAISVSYNASYDPTDLTHSNYKFFTYKNSAVDSITIGCDFTAQDTAEAQYLLAVIHFFRSATKMFYGQDQNPKNGTPPPLCYLSGLGAFQFDAHPLAITGFTYTLPTDVDYIKAGSTATPGGVNRGNSPMQGKPGESIMAQASASRMSSSGINPGAVSAPPNWQQDTGTKEPTYVPTKINLSITAVPIVTRNDISNKFSLKDYATGALLRGTRRAGGGIW